MTTVHRGVQALVEKWRKEEADYKRLASEHAAYGGHLYTRYMAKWELAQRYATELASALASLPPAPSSAEPPAPEDHLDIYVPGVLRCPLCSFEHTTASLFVRTGEIGLTRAEALCEHVGEPCPNDGAPMVKVRWSERAQQNYEAYGELMNRIIAIAGLSVQVNNLPAALETLQRLAAASLPPADGGGLREALEAHIAWLRISADDIKALGYLEAWNERQVCANELEQLLASPRPSGEER